MLIPVYNPETTDLEKSYLSNPYPAGATSLEIKNNNRVTSNDRIMLGEMGNEATEIVTVSAVSANGTTLTTGATVFPHSADDPVYVLRFDQVKFYRSTDGGVNYSILSTEAMDVDNADLTTKYDDTSGLPAYYYKFSFYHSIDLVESDFSDVIAGTGWRREQFGRIIDEILQEVSDPQEMNITRTELLGYFNDVNDDLQVSVAKPYSFLYTRAALTRTAARNYIDFPTDSDGKQTMWMFDHMDYNFTDATTSPAVDDTSTITVIPPTEFRNLYPDNTIDSTTESDDKPVQMCLDTSVNRFRFSHPALTTLANVFYLHYWKYFDVIDSEGDIIETPTPKIYKLYAKHMYYTKRTLSDVNFSSLASKYNQDYQVEKVHYKTVNRKDAGTPRSFRPETASIRSFRG